MSGEDREMTPGNDELEDTERDIEMSKLEAGRNDTNDRHSFEAGYHGNESHTRLIGSSPHENEDHADLETGSVVDDDDLPLYTEYRKATTDDNEGGSRDNSRIIKYLFLLTIPTILGFLAYLVITQQTPAEARDASPGAAPTGVNFPSGFDMKNNWGSYSPYFGHGTKFDGIEHGDTLLPPGSCRYKQVHVLHRHAERFPTTNKGNHMKSVAGKLKDMSEPPSSSELSWMADSWEYNLGTDLLVPKGVSSEFSSGSLFWSTHGTFLYNATGNGRLFYDPDVLNRYDNGTERPIPVLRATNQSRIHTSAKAWAAGFFGVYGNQDYSPADDDDEEGKLYKLVLMDEADGQNNTLASYYSCPNGNNNDTLKEIVEKKIQRFSAIYLDSAHKRIQKLLPGYDNLTTWDTLGMQHICVFETAVYGDSRFCGLFTEAEWRGYEYTHDLDFYYQSGFGSHFGPAIGSGWLTELLARLKGIQLTRSSHGVNTTIAGSPSTFPIDQPFYLDMTHDAVIVAVLTALDLKFLENNLPDSKLLVPRSFIISRLTPFSARLYVELLECDDDESAESMHIRIKLNDRILPLHDLYYCPKSKDGLCPFDKFRRSLEKRLEEIDFGAVCYGSHEKTDN